MEARHMRDLGRAIQSATPVPGRVKVRRLAGGTMTDFTPKKKVRQISRPLLLAFIVTRTGAATVSIAAGHAQTQTGDLIAVSAVSSLTISAETQIFARYDLGLAGTSSPAWEVVSGSILQSAGSLPSYSARYRVIPIATVTWSGMYIDAITQHMTGVLLCPDKIPQDFIAAFNVAYGTTIYGWRICDGSGGLTLDLRKKFLSGKGAGDSLAAGSDKATITAASLNAMDAGHIHPLPYVDTVSVQLFDAGLGGAPIGIDRVGAYTNGPYTAPFTGSTDLDIIPTNASATFYAHL